MDGLFNPLLNWGSKYSKESRVWTVSYKHDYVIRLLLSVIYLLLGNTTCFLKIIGRPRYVKAE